MLAVVLGLVLASWAQRSGLQPATVGSRPGRVARRSWGPSRTSTAVLAAVDSGQTRTGAAPAAGARRGTAPSGRRRRRRPKALRIPWWRRLRSAVALTLIVGMLGLGLAAVIGALLFLAGFLLEQVVAS